MRMYSECSVLSTNRDASATKSITKIKCSRKLAAMANLHTMDQYLSLLRYFLIITIAKLQNNICYSAITGYIMRHSRLRIYIPRGAAEWNMHPKPGMSHIPSLIAE